METVKATLLKNRLGAVLKRAALGPVAIERHGKIVACLVPPPARAGTARPRPSRSGRNWSRRQEERVVELCALGDYRPSRWLRAGNPTLLAGVATMLASQPEFDRARMLALAERLHPGMSTPPEFGRWLERTPVQAARFLPMLRARLRAAESGPQA
jgi:antitoxin (DNA-binding transcriptional repressor) of toxin-antitoxin stability system